MVSRWLWPGNGTFLEVTSMVVTWWIVPFLSSVYIYGENRSDTWLAPVFHSCYNHSATYIAKDITKISEVNSFAFIYRLFHEDFSSIVGTNTVAYSQLSTCLIYINLGVGWGSYYNHSKCHSTKKPVTTMLTYPWKCTVLHCNHLGNTWKPLVLMT